MDIYSLLRPLLFSLNPETSHHVSLSSLRYLARLKLSPLFFGTLPLVPRTVMGLTFPNPVGLAAGLDKDAVCIDGMAGLGFGFIEVGTVTPRPQSGNPQPRLFRLTEANALINRMGFNNNGLEYLLENVKKRQFGGPLGINIGKNASTHLDNALDDYLTCLEHVYPHADYVTVNVSSPNTPGLRNLQTGDSLERLLAGLKDAQARLSTEHSRYVPLAIKIAPDLEEDELQSTAAKLMAYAVDGVIATNTTLSRTHVEGLPHADEKGGLSGAPLSGRSTEVVRQLHDFTDGKLPIIAVGGIMSVEQALEKFDAGADLVQLYTGLIYQGPNLIKNIVKAVPTESRRT
ncbi:MAG: quinone-dependent dihydroorotate dehydrogenase [Pseudomonadota bacterium]